jgi:hypothetical protein
MGERTPGRRAGSNRDGRPLIRVRTPDADDAPVIPLPTRAARRPRPLSPLWSEVAWVLARARVPAQPQRPTDEADRKAA